MEFKQLLGWEYSTGCLGETPFLTVVAPDRKSMQEYLSKLSKDAAALMKWNNPVLLFIECKGSKHRYQVPLRSIAELPSEPESVESPIDLEPSISPLTLSIDADHEALMMWMLEQRSQGKSVCVTSQIDNKCLFQNDKLPVSRGVIQPAEFIGHNYLWNWRDTMEDYRDLRSRLDSLIGDRDYIPGYEYRLRRPDGKMCKYATNYYRATFLNVPVRIGVSSPEDWELLE